MPKSHHARIQLTLETDLSHPWVSASGIKTRNHEIWNVASGRDNILTTKNHISISCNKRQIWHILMQATDIGVHNTTRPAWSSLSRILFHIRRLRISQATEITFVQNARKSGVQYTTTIEKKMQIAITGALKETSLEAPLTLPTSVGSGEMNYRKGKAVGSSGIFIKWGRN